MGDVVQRVSGIASAGCIKTLITKRYGNTGANAAICGGVREETCINIAYNIIFSSKIHNYTESSVAAQIDWGNS